MSYAFLPSSFSKCLRFGLFNAKWEAVDLYGNGTPAVEQKGTVQHSVPSIGGSLLEFSLATREEWF